MSDLIKTWGAIALVIMAELIFVSPVAVLYTILVGWNWSTFLVVWPATGVGVPIMVCLASVPVAGPPGSYTTRVSSFFWLMIGALTFPFGLKIASLWCASMGWFAIAGQLWSLRWPSLLLALAALLAWPLLRRGCRFVTDYGWYPFWLGWHLARARASR